MLMPSSTARLTVERCIERKRLPRNFFQNRSQLRNTEAMSLSRPDTTWMNVKNDISRMQKCLVESIRVCETLEQGHLTQLKIELSAAKKRVYELEHENASLRIHLQVGNNIGGLAENRFTAGGGMTESLQTEVDQHLLKAKQENDMLRKRISELEVQAECLKEQINIYKEDFEMERKDRENAQDRFVELQRQMALMSGSRQHQTGNYSPTPPHAQSGSRHHQTVNCTATPHHPYGRPRIRGFDVCDDVSSVSDGQGTIVCTAVDGGRLENSANHGLDVCDLRESDAQQESLGLTGRGFGSVSKFRTDGETHENYSTGAESFSTTSPYLLTDKGSGSALSFNVSSPPLVNFQNIDLTGALSCPNCWRNFSTEDHMLLLEHLEVCN